MTYRRLYNIPETWGTAVNVVAMVFGNMGETSGTGVAFTRDPATGQRQFFGECLTNAQGEDVVAGIRTPLPVNQLEKFMPQAYKDLEVTYKKLERHYRDMLDLEFTIRKASCTCCRPASKRTGVAAVRIAVDMVKEGLISKGSPAADRPGPVGTVSLSNFRCEGRIALHAARQGIARRPRSRRRKNRVDGGSGGRDANRR